MGPALGKTAKWAPLSRLPQRDLVDSPGQFQVARRDAADAVGLELHGHLSIADAEIRIMSGRLGDVAEGRAQPEAWRRFANQTRGSNPWAR